MAKAAPKPCNNPRCQKLTQGTYCEACKPLYGKDAGRKTFHQRGYTYRWRKARLAWLKAHPLCVECGGPATEVDHIRPHNGDIRLFWNIKNWQSMCRSCHSRKTMTELNHARSQIFHA
jgi:5-methylcytosine-specific restriction protein A